MRWPIGALDAAAQRRLEQISKQGGLSDVPCYFQPTARRNLVPLGVIFLLLAALGAALAWALIPQESKWIGGVVAAVLGALSLLWSVVLFAEVFRGAASPIKPFFLLTPRVLFRCDYRHGHLEAYKLADATDFSSTQTYDEKQNYKGLQYVFKFPGATVVHTAKDDIGVLEQVLAQARAGAADLGPCGLDLIPSTAGTLKGSGWRAFTDPFGEFWMGALGLLILAGIAGIVLAAIFG